jgi:membrane-associated protease RseP (regulator of RpoE activity)
MGAFIRIKSPIYSRRGLFDIGIAGPLAGFVALLPFLIAGIYMSHSFRGPAPTGPFLFGTPLAFRLVEFFSFPATNPTHILLHPTAMAAWAGLLATAINLLPVGQLDGGHIVYAVLGQRLHRLVSTVLVGVLAIMGFWFWTWWIWCVLLFFLGRRHPLVYDSAPLSRLRWVSLAFVCLVFLLSFSVIPVRTT